MSSLIRPLRPRPSSVTKLAGDAAGHDVASTDHPSSAIGLASADSLTSTLEPVAEFTEVQQAQPVQPDQRTYILSRKLNWLRAGVLGANDGIVSVAAVVLGVAGATSQMHPILMAGLAALVGGAFSMALGEYVSVSSQRDALGARAARGEDADPEEASAWHAALASFLAFLCGGIIPFLAMVILPASVRVPLTFAVVLLALTGAGWVSAVLGEAPPLRATLRMVVGGAIALVITYGIGMLLGTVV